MSSQLHVPLAFGRLRWKWALQQLNVRMTFAERKFLLVVVDLLLLNGSLLAAVTLWNGFDPSVSLVIEKAKWFITLSAVWLWFGMVLDVYDLPRAASVTTVVTSMGMAVVLTDLIYVAIPWFTPPVNARLYMFGLVGFSLAALLAWRVLYALMFNHMAFRRKAIILGTEPTAQALMRELNQLAEDERANPFRGTGYHVIGLVSEQESPNASEDGAATLGNLRHLVRLARIHQVDEVIIALNAESEADPEVCQVLLDCRELGLRITSVAEIYERLTSRLPVVYARYNLQTLLGQTDSPSTRLYHAFKSAVDFVFVLCGLVVLGLVIPFVALANALGSPGPLFYSQERVGKGGRPFAVLKFRSMRTDAEKADAVWCGDRDPRITPVGYWLRKTRLDELPQVINVLRGEMSVVGPRPERPHFVGQLVHELPLYRARNAVKPGITGWAQIRYHYGNSVEDSRIKLEYDLYYIKHANLFLDLLIMFQTAPVILLFKGQ